MNMQFTTYWVHVASTMAYLRDTNADLLVAVHDCPIEWLVKDVGDAGTDVREESDRVTDEVSRTKDAIQLTENFLSVVMHDTFLKVWQSESHVFNSQCVHLQRCIIDVPDGHGNRVEDNRKRIAQAQPIQARSAVKEVAMVR